MGKRGKFFDPNGLRLNSSIHRGYDFQYTLATINLVTTTRSKAGEGVHYSLLPVWHFEQGKCDMVRKNFFRGLSETYRKTGVFWGLTEIQALIRRCNAWMGNRPELPQVSQLRANLGHLHCVDSCD